MRATYYLVTLMSRISLTKELLALTLAKVKSDKHRSKACADAATATSELMNVVSRR